MPVEVSLVVCVVMVGVGVAVARSELIKRGRR